MTVSSLRPRLLGMVLLAVVFVAGALAGAAFDRVAMAGPASAAAREERCEQPRRKQGLVVDQVNPTPEQRVRIDSILERRRAQTDAFWRGAEGQRLRSIVDSTRGEIRAVLTPEQAAHYDRLREERAARHREREQEREKSGGGGGEEE